MKEGAQVTFDPDGLLDDLKKALAERVLNAEDMHSGWGKCPLEWPE